MANHETMSAEELRQATELLAPSYPTRRELAAKLRVLQPRLSEWAMGRRAVPPYIAAHVETLLEVQELHGIAAPVSVTIVGDQEEGEL